MSRIPRRVVAPSALVILILLLPLLLAAGVASGVPAGGGQRAAAPAFLLQWGSKGAGAGQFDRPGFIAVDDNGNVYVADTANHRIQKFDGDGEYVGQWGRYGTGDADFNLPSGIAVSPGTDTDPAQYVYVVDSLHNRIQKFTPDGGFITKWGKLGAGSGEFLVPSGVAVGPSGNVYVVDQSNHRIQVFGASGAYIRQWGSRGAGAGQFSIPKGIAVDSRENVYVVDQGSHCLQEFSPNGDFIAKWGGLGTGDGQLNSPSGVAVDASDNVYVTDVTNMGRVQKFTSAGTFLAKWDIYRSGDAFAPQPMGIVVEQFGAVFVVDANNQCVKKYGRAAPPEDLVPPKTTVKGADKKWHNVPVTLTFSATDNAGGAGVDYSEARLQDWLWHLLWGRWIEGSRYVVPASGDHSDDGDRTVQYRSVDLAGNVEKEKQVKVLIDTRAPKVTVQPAAARHDKTAVIKFKVQDQLSPQVKVLAEVLDAAGTVVNSATSKWLPRKGANGWSFICRLTPGRYATRITATDLAGNSSDSPGLGTLTVK